MAGHFIVVPLYQLPGDKAIVNYNFLNVIVEPTQFLMSFHVFF